MIENQEELRVSQEKIRVLQEEISVLRLQKAELDGRTISGSEGESILKSQELHSQAGLCGLFITTNIESASCLFQWKD